MFALSAITTFILLYFFGFFFHADKYGLAFLPENVVFAILVFFSLRLLCKEWILKNQSNQPISQWALYPILGVAFFIAIKLIHFISASLATILQNGYSNSCFLVCYSSGWYFHLAVGIVLLFFSVAKTRNKITEKAQSTKDSQKRIPIAWIAILVPILVVFSLIGTFIYTFDFGFLNPSTPFSRVCDLEPAPIHQFGLDGYSIEYTPIDCYESGVAYKNPQYTVVDINRTWKALFDGEEAIVKEMVTGSHSRGAFTKREYDFFITQTSTGKSPFLDLAFHSICEYVDNTITENPTATKSCDEQATTPSYIHIYWHEELPREYGIEFK